MSLYDPKFIEEFINFFEETEMSLLTWGFYNISYNSSEFEDLFQKNASNDLKQNGMTAKIVMALH